jgi:hypothetical protein
MPARTTGAATIRHVGLVALEALLVAMIVWIATMALAGASHNGGLIGAASAGDAPGSFAVDATRSDGRVIVSAGRGAGSWTHVACRDGAAVVATRWVRIGPEGRAIVGLDPSLGRATCVAEHGYFSANGKWRVFGAAPFTLRDGPSAGVGER